MASGEVFTPASENLDFLQSSSEDATLEDTVKINPYQPAHEECKTDHLVSKVDILDFGDEGFLLKNVMHESECGHYITQGESIGFRNIYGSKKKYRNATRIMVMSQELADTLWTRVTPFLRDIKIEGDPHRIHVHGPASILQGTWKPQRINPVFRLCKYEPGGHFAPHFDGHFVVSSRERSMKTIMLYLNDKFDAGTTNFVDESQTLYQDSEGKYCAEEKNVLHRIKPETGMAIVFNHHRLHEGEAVRNGVKYILRSDILYEKDAANESDPKEEMAFQLIQEAERLEGAGECLRAMELYRRAFKLSPSLEASYG